MGINFLKWATVFGGEGGIRTLGTRKSSLDFESSPFGQLWHLSNTIHQLMMLPELCKLNRHLTCLPLTQVNFYRPPDP